MNKNPDEFNDIKIIFKKIEELENTIKEKSNIIKKLNEKIINQENEIKELKKK